MIESQRWTRRARLRLQRRIALRVLHLPGPIVRGIGRRWLTSVDGRTLDPQCAALARLDEFRGPVEVADHTVPHARRRLAQGISLLDLPPPTDVSIREISAQGAAGRLVARLYTPHGLAEGSPLVVYFHGGGWVTCSLDTHESYCAHTARLAGVRLVSVDYRLAPEHPFPAAVDDALASFRDIASRASELGGDPARVAVMGDSAGGNLSAVVSQRTKGEPHQPVLQVLVYPGVDATFSSQSHQHFARGYFLTRRSIDWYIGHYAGPTDRRDPDLSPLYREDVSGAAPALVYTAGFDPLRDEGAAYAKKLADAGVRTTHREFPTLVHGFTLMAAAVDAARVANDEIAADVGRALSQV